MPTTLFVRRKKLITLKEAFVETLQNVEMFVCRWMSGSLTGSTSVSTTELAIGVSALAVSLNRYRSGRCASHPNHRSHQPPDFNLVVWCFHAIRSNKRPSSRRRFRVPSTNTNDWSDVCMFCLWSGIQPMAVASFHFSVLSLRRPRSKQSIFQGRSLVLDF
jgi:hypothetical protein